MNVADYLNGAELPILPMKRYRHSMFRTHADVEFRSILASGIRTSFRWWIVHCHDGPAAKSSINAHHSDPSNTTLDSV
jgi:hypothetical protein